MISEYSEYPSFDQYFMPVLETYKSGGEITEREVKKMIYEKYYSNYSLETLVGKSSEPLIYSRAHWAIYFLFAGKYLERVAKGTYKISDKGIKFLSTGKVMTLEYLRKDEDFHNSSFVVNKNKKDKTQKNNNILDDESELSPEDMLERSFNQIEASKKDELLQRLREIEPTDFEKVVGNLCEKMGYGTFIETPKSHDGGVDGIIKGDTLGFEKIYIQAKRYAEDNVVNGKEMRGFIGALSTKTVRKAIFFTTSSFAPAAEKEANDASVGGKDIILIDGNRLVDLMFEYNLGVQAQGKPYILKHIDEDYFDNLS